MALGPGHYDEAATLIREKHKALGVIVLVIEGDHGSGFSVQGPLDVLQRLPELLHHMAEQIAVDQAINGPTGGPK